jgi:hypothetical protein
LPKPAFTETGSCGFGVGGRRRDELEEERRLADDDLAASLLAELHLVGLPGAPVSGTLRAWRLELPRDR